MNFSVFGWLFSFVLAAVLLFLMVYMLITISDLEHDFLNPQEFASKSNWLILPEYAAQVGLTALFLLTGSFMTFLFNLPLAAWHVRSYRAKSFLYDATNVFSDEMRKRKRTLYIKLGFYLISFFLYLYQLIATLVSGLVSKPTATEFI